MFLSLNRKLMSSITLLRILKLTLYDEKDGNKKQIELYTLSISVCRMIYNNEKQYIIS